MQYAQHSVILPCEADGGGRHQGGAAEGEGHNELVVRLFIRWAILIFMQNIGERVAEDQDAEVEELEVDWRGQVYVEQPGWVELVLEGRTE